MPPEAKESVEHQGERSGEGDYDQAGAERDRDRLTMSVSMVFLIR